MLYQPNIYAILLLYQPSSEES